MPESPFKSVSRALFRWYLSKFPLRDGKAYFYEKFHSGLMPVERLLTVTLDQGFKMKLDLEDAEQRKVYFFGHYHERYEAALVARLLDPGEVFWDIGANVGYFSLVAAARLQEAGQVVAFEPGAAALARLTENVSLNPFKNIRVFNLAVADRDGEATLYRAEGIADSSASLFAAAAGAAGGETCATVALDSLRSRENLAPPDFVKLDVEGAELAALARGRRHPGRLPTLIAGGNGRKKPGRRRRLQGRHPEVLAGLRLPGRPSPQGPLALDRRRQLNPRPQYLLVQPRYSQTPGQGGAGLKS